MWAGAHEGVEFPTLSARIYRLRQLGEERVVEHATREGRGELVRINADHHSPITRPHELGRERFRVTTPKWKQRLEGCAGQQSLAIRSHVAQEQVTEGNVCYFGCCHAQLGQ